MQSGEHTHTPDSHNVLTEKSTSAIKRAGIKTKCINH